MPVTIRSRCRVVALRTPPVDAIADVLVRRDGVDPALAAWSAGAAGGHVGRARRLARDEDARLARKAVLDVPLSLVSLAACLDAAATLVEAAQEEADAATAGWTPPRPSVQGQPGRRGPRAGRAAAAGAPGSSRSWRRRQKSRPPGWAATPSTGPWSTSPASTATRWSSTRRPDPPQLHHPDRRADAQELARRIGAEGALRRIDALLACRPALEQNVKPRIALEALTVALRLPA